MGRLNELQAPRSRCLIGVILGSLYDESERRALLFSDADLSVFVTRPAAGILAALNLMLILSQLLAVRSTAERLMSGRRTKACDGAGVLPPEICMTTDSSVIGIICDTVVPKPK